MHRLKAKFLPGFSREQFIEMREFGRPGGQYQVTDPEILSGLKVFHLDSQQAQGLSHVGEASIRFGKNDRTGWVAGFALPYSGQAIRHPMEVIRAPFVDDPHSQGDFLPRFRKTKRHPLCKLKRPDIGNMGMS